MRAESLGKRLRAPLPLRRASSFELREISFSVAPGERVALLGNNGAGKTTLLRLLAGIYRADRGSVAVRGVCSPIIGFTSPFSPSLTAREHLRATAALAGYALDVEEALRVTALADRADLPVRRLSTGQRTRLGLVAGLLMPADLYLVDEGLAVCDAPFRSWASEHLRMRCAQGSAAIVAGQDLLSARSLCGRGLVLRRGSLVADAEIDSAIAAATAGEGVPSTGAEVEVVETTAERSGAGPVLRVRCRVRGAPDAFQLTLAVRDHTGTGLFLSRTRIAATGEDPVLLVPTSYLAPGRYTLYLTLSDAAGVPLATRSSAALVEL